MYNVVFCDEVKFIMYLLYSHLHFFHAYVILSSKYRFLFTDLYNCIY